MDWLLVFLIVAAAILVPWVWAGTREKPLTHAERSSKAPGKTCTLSAGTIYYTDSGDRHAPVIVMVHGFSVPHFVFAQNAAALVENGFRVIQFDHFGRGWSDRPAGRYDTDFYDRELIELLDALDLHEPVGLVGYSMGGVIAAEFAARHPERLTGLLLLAPAGFSLNLFSNPLVRAIMRTPLLGDWYWQIFGRGLLLADPQLAQPHIDPTRCIQGDDTIQMNYKGYLHAILATWRNLQMENRDTTFASAAANDVPIMTIFGGQDLTIRPESVTRLKKAAPQSRIEVLTQGNHGLGFELYDSVNPLMVEFFNTHSK